MQDLKVIGVESGALLAASEDGERYRIAIDEVLQSKLRQNRAEQQSAGVKVSPREIQAQIRAGLSAEDVAELTGAALEYVQRFEGPIIAEREHVVAQALSVPVRTAADVDVLGEANTFGVVIRDRLAALGAGGERWASWKEEDGGWIVKLSFTADGIDHDARWNYEPRKASLAPANPEATTLSQHGELPQGGLIPRLRAVTPLVTDESRFDSGAFEYVSRHSPEPAPVPFAPVPFASGHTPAPQAPVGAIKRAEPEEVDDVHNTADLLEALRRRRGERDAAGSPAVEADTPLDLDFDASPVEQADAPSGAVDEGAAPAASVTGSAAVPEGPSPTPAPATGSSVGALGARAAARRGRASMPSWDEIVFGARGDDDGGNLA